MSTHPSPPAPQRPAPSQVRSRRTVGIGRHRWRVKRREPVVCAVLALLVLLVGCAALCRGTEWQSPAQVWEVAQGPAAFIVLEWRLPRIVAAVVFGAALGLAGAIFQNITRNPLGSPDIIGLDAGAYTGALVAITLMGATASQLSAMSIVGGLAAATTIYLLSLKSGFSGVRLIIIGIAINAMLTAFNSWIILRADIDTAIASTAWSAGSLNGLDWAEVQLPMAVIGVLCLVLVLSAADLHQSALGDELALTTGVGLNRARVVLIAIGVGCTATVTAVAGPIVFVALAAPQIGRRLAGSSGVALLPAALTGALVLLGSDLIAQVLLAPVPLPVGVVTTAVGGVYLLWLLAREVRR